MLEFGKVAGLLVFSALKFLLAPAATVLAGYNFWQTILITSLGGIVGFYLFFRFGEVLEKGFKFIIKPKRKKVFSRKNKMIVKLKNKYGLWGLAILTPCLFGVPLGAILAGVYYREQKGSLFIFFALIISWSFLLTTFSIYLKPLL